MSLEYRKVGIGGTDISKLTGTSPYAGPLTLYRSKVLGHEQQDNPLMEWGRRLEGAVAQKFADEYGAEIRSVEPLVDLSVPAVYSVDRLAVIGGVECVLEIKTAQKEWDDIPKHYWEQVQWYLGGFNLSTGYLAVLVRGCSFAVYKIDADPAWYAKAKVLAAGFWQAHILAGREPEPTMADLEILSHEESAGEVDLGEVGSDLVDALHREKQILKKQEEIVDQLEGKLKLMLGSHEKGSTDNGCSVMWQTIQGRESADLKLLVEHPVAYAACVRKGKPYRKLSYRLSDEAKKKPTLPASRGTTSGELLVMHSEAEAGKP